MAVLLFGWVLSDLRSKWMLDSGLDLRPMVRHVAVGVPVPAILWYDCLHPNAGLKILSGAAAGPGIWDWARQRQRSDQGGAGQMHKRVARCNGAEGSRD